MNKILFKKSLIVSNMDYMKWLTDKKMVLMLILLSFIYTQVLDIFKEMSTNMKESYHFFEPFISLGNNIGFSLLLVSFYLILLSEFMKKSEQDYMIFFYSGKKAWIIGKFMFLLRSSFTYLCIILVFTCVFSLKSGYFGNEWSRVVLEYTKEFPEKIGTHGTEFIDGRLFRQMSVVRAFVNSFFLNWLYLIILGQVIMVFFIFHRGKYGVMASALLFGIGTGTAILNNTIKWIFPSAHSNLAYHYNDYLRELNFSVTITYILEVSFIVTIFALLIYFSKNISYLDFDENNS